MARRGLWLPQQWLRLVSEVRATRVKLLAGAILLAVGTGAGVLPLVLHVTSQSSASLSPLLAGNIAVVSLGTAAVMLGLRRSRIPVVVFAPWLGCGCLLGAGLIGPIQIAPYVSVAAIALAAVATTRGIGGIRGVLARTGCVAVGVLMNFAFLWPFTLGHHRPVAHAAYLSTELRAHTLLADVPLHDVWVVHLPGGGEGRTLADVNEAMAGIAWEAPGALVVTLVVYELAARVLGLAREECVDTSASAAGRLTEADRQRSMQTGEHGFVYHFGREALLEIQTCVAHALYAFALEREEGGYALYWGVYAIRASWVTPYYMRLIDPLRRFVVYPSVLGLIERRWRDKWAHRDAEATASDEAQSTLDGGRRPASTDAIR